MKKQAPATNTQELILRKMGLTVFIKGSTVWLDLGAERNAVLGGEQGVPAGKMFQLAGPKHTGKTAETMDIAAEAQKQHNAFVIWVDAENSMQNEHPTGKFFRNAWAAKMGLSTHSNNFYRVYPKILSRTKARKKGKKVTKAGDDFLQSAEFLFAEAETVMKWAKTKWADRPIFLAVDSIANLQTELVVDTGGTEKNMRTGMDRAMFLSDILPRWTTLADNYTVWVFLINQVRTNPAVLFGDNEYSPGGKALDHNCHVQVKLRAVKGGVELIGEQVIGIRGKMINVKNKAGGGSRQGMTCGYRISFNKPAGKMFRYMSLKEVEKGDKKGNDDGK